MLLKAWNPTHPACLLPVLPVLRALPVLPSRTWSELSTTSTASWSVRTSLQHGGALAPRLTCAGRIFRQIIGKIALPAPLRFT